MDNNAFMYMVAVDYIGDLRQREAMFAREKDLLLKEKAAFQNRRDYP